MAPENQQRSTQQKPQKIPNAESSSKESEVAVKAGRNQNTGRKRRQPPSNTGNPKESNSVHSSSNATEERDWSKVITDLGLLKAWIVGNGQNCKAEEAVFELDTTNQIQLHEKQTRQDRKETHFSTSTEEKLVTERFSELGIQAALSAGLSGVSANASVGASSYRSNTNQSTRSIGESGTCKLDCHPQVSLNLTESGLRLSDYCLKWFNKRTDEEKIEDVVAGFQKTFGIIFVQRLLLGGCIVETYRESKSTAVESNNSKTESHLSGKLSATAEGAGLEMGGHRTAGKNTSDHRESTADKGWSERTIIGGITGLYDSQPDEWNRSVDQGSNWDVIQRDNVVPLLPLLMKVAEKTKHASCVAWAKNMISYLENKEMRENPASQLILIEIEWSCTTRRLRNDECFYSFSIPTNNGMLSHVEFVIAEVDNTKTTKIKMTGSSPGSMSKTESTGIATISASPFKRSVSFTTRCKSLTIKAFIVAKEKWSFKQNQHLELTQVENLNQNSPQPMLSAARVETEIVLKSPPKSEQLSIEIENIWNY